MIGEWAIGLYTAPFPIATREMCLSGVRESNPPSWLGKPEHYHYANPANGAAILPCYSTIVNTSR